MKEKISIEVSDAASGIDCLVLFNSDDRLIKSIPNKTVKNIQTAINNYDDLINENKQLIESLNKLVYAASNLDYDIYRELGPVGDYQENEAITESRKLLSEIKGDK